MSNRVLVSGLTSEFSNEELELFLESPRFCSIGGEVLDTERISDDKAVVTFKDYQVAIHVVGEKLSMPSGHVISFESYNRNSPMENSDSSDEDKNGWCSSDSDMETNLKVGISGDDEDQKCEIVPVNTTSPCNLPVQGGPSHSVLQQPSFAADGHTNNLESNQVQLGSESRKEVEEVMSFTPEKLSFVRMILCSDVELLRCRAKLDFVGQKLRLRGSEDDVTNAKMTLLAYVIDIDDEVASFPQEFTEVLLSDRGKNWMQIELLRLGYPAMFYTKNGQQRVIAKNRDALQTLIQRNFIKEDVQFKENQLTFLQSATWTGYQTATKSSRLVSFRMQESLKVVTVTGITTDVRHTVTELKKLLRQNNSVTRSMKYKIGVVRLLEALERKKEITAALTQSTSSMVSIGFDTEKGSVNLSGLHDDVDRAVKVIESIVKNICYDTYEVRSSGLSAEMFTKRDSTGKDLLDLLEVKNECVIEVRTSQRRSRGHRAREAERPQSSLSASSSSASSFKNDRIQVIQGNIVEFKKADVLVNPVQTFPGAVMKCFLETGGKKLKQELEEKGYPKDFGKDVTVTSKHDHLAAKLVFHAVIANYRNPESVERMNQTIGKCLEMAQQHKATSIAFPTLGCGNLGFRPQVVAGCFRKAAEKIHGNLTIYIVVMDEKILREFKTGLVDHGHQTTRQRSPSDSHSAFVFHINAMTKEKLQNVKTKLVQKISEMAAEEPIQNKAIGRLRQEAIDEIKALQSPQVAINIDKSSNTITVRGEKFAVQEARLKVCGVIYKESAKHERDRLQNLIDFNRVPEYWTKYRDLAKVTSGCEKYALPSTSELYKEISNIVMSTWEPQNVGKGNDAFGLTNHTIRICKIYCIENPGLFRKYLANKQQMSIAAASNPSPRIKGLKNNEPEVSTMKLHLKHLGATLAGTVNECFLLHGTKKEVAKAIHKEGLDSRLSGEDAMFGHGTYFTESSTKADQYADPKDQRVSNGKSLYMLVCRVLLGSPFICDNPERFKRPPCKQCYTESCTTHHKYRGRFDSVIGTHAAHQRRLLFREFIIYHPDQSYPDFLVKYERV